MAESWHLMAVSLAELNSCPKYPNPFQRKFKCMRFKSQKEFSFILLSFPQSVTASMFWLLLLNKVLESDYADIFSIKIFTL